LFAVAGGQQKLGFFDSERGTLCRIFRKNNMMPSRKAQESFFGAGKRPTNAGSGGTGLLEEAP
jgi:hypothetical protein